MVRPLPEAPFRIFKSRFLWSVFFFGLRLFEPKGGLSPTESIVPGASEFSRAFTVLLADNPSGLVGDVFRLKYGQENHAGFA